MNQPPKPAPPDDHAIPRRPDWLRPSGVAEGTWAYTQQRSIADHYADFVEGTPLCHLDQQFIRDTFPPLHPATNSTVSAASAGDSGAPAGEDSKIPAAKIRRPLILDLGCGNGRSLIPLARRGYRTLGVDLSQPMLEAYAGDAWKLRCNLVDLQCLADASVDHVICMFSTLGMIHGAANRGRVLRHARRLVRPSGTLVLHVHNRASGWTEPGGRRKLLASWFRSLRDPEHDFGDEVYRYRGLEKMYLHRFSRREITASVNRAGWRIRCVKAISLDGTGLVDWKAWQPHRAGGFLIKAVA